MRIDGGIEQLFTEDELTVMHRQANEDAAEIGLTSTIHPGNLLKDQTPHAEMHIGDEVVKADKDGKFIWGEIVAAIEKANAAGLTIFSSDIALMAFPHAKHLPPAGDS